MRRLDVEHLPERAGRNDFIDFRASSECSEYFSDSSEGCALGSGFMESRSLAKDETKMSESVDMKREAFIFKNRGLRTPKLDCGSFECPRLGKKVD